MAGDRVARPGLIELLSWMSPAFPVGAFAYSHGVEWAVEAGDVADRSTAEAWIETVLRCGAGRSDVVLLAEAHRAQAARDGARLAAVAELAAAFQPSRERAAESENQGAAFLATAAAAWPAPQPVLLAEVWDGPFAYPVAVGAVAGAHGLALADAATGYLHAFASNLISAAVRLVPLGQTDGQRILAALVGAIRHVAAEGCAGALDDLGGAALRADIASMRHETQYTRLFRS